MYTFTKQSLSLMSQGRKSFEDMVGKGEKEKMLVTNIFSFLHCYFHPTKDIPISSAISYLSATKVLVLTGQNFVIA